jgi:phage shock protein PspC (stress-responsive transcriptional regulator)
MNTTTDAPRSEQPPPPPPPPVRPLLRRRRDDRIIGGVAGGIADHLGVDVALVRIVLVVLGLLNGLGVLLYVIAWIAVPEAESGVPTPPPGRVAAPGGRDPLFWVGVGLLVVGAIALVTGPLALLPSGSAPQLVVPLVLIGFGLALWRVGGSDDTVAPAAPPAPPADATRPATGAPAEAASGAPHTTGVSPTSTPPAEATPGSAGARAGAGAPDGAGARGQPGAPGGPAGPDAPRTDLRGGDTSPPASLRPRSWVTRATLGLALVVVGVLWILRLADVAPVGVGAILSAALLVIGLGLLVGSVVGRARWLLLAGGLLLPLVLVAQLSAPGIAALAGAWDAGDGGRAAGQFRLAPSDLDELEAGYRLGAGSLELDLTGVDFGDDHATVVAEVGAGEIHVIVPDDVELLAVGQAGIGQVSLFGERTTAGLGAGPIRATHTPDDPRGSVELHLSTGVGQVEVTTASATSDDGAAAAATETAVLR